MLLEVQNVSKHFGGIQAVDNCSLDVEEGTITGLIGPNGAGKTTLFNLITGFHRVDRGKIFFAGEDITSLPPNEIFHKGLFRTFQIVRGYEDMTVLESLLVMPTHQSGENFWNLWFNTGRIAEQEKKFTRRALEVLDFLEMENRKKDLARNLPGGEKKLLDLGRMMMANPDIAFLDEPGAGVPPTLQHKVNDYVRKISDEEDTTFFIVEHDMNVIMDLCNPIIVMVEGSKLTEGTPEEIKSNEEVIEAYLGEEETL
mgnify:CR=1 FL=1